ncbi:MAG: hypothetical protein ABEL51_07550 [Salinibacter sp.]
MQQESEEPTDVDLTVEALRHRVEVTLQESLEEEWAEVLDQWSGGGDDERTWR